MLKLLLAFARPCSLNFGRPIQKTQIELKQWVLHLDNLKKMQRQEKNRLESSCKSVSVAIRRHIKGLELQINKAETHIKGLIKSSQDLNQKRELLLTIPGIGETTVATILAYFGNISRFDSAKKLASFTGLTPSHKQSGTSVRGRTSLSKRGNPTLRKSMFMPAMVAIKYNPILSAFYLKLLERGKTKMCGIGAVMRKMLHIIYGVLKHNKPFHAEINT